MSYTPGPWTITQANCCDNDCAEYTLEELRERVEELDRDDQNYDEQLKVLWAEGLANKALIAAAPALVEALEGLLKIEGPASFEEGVINFEDGSALDLNELLKLATGKEY